MYTMDEDIKKPPRPWSADIGYTRTKSNISHDNQGRLYDTTVSSNCCVYECRNPPNTPVYSSQQKPLRQDSLSIRTTSHSAPPLNFTTTWNPLVDRHPGSAFDVVSSTSSSRTSTPVSESRSELCSSKPIIRPVPRRSTSMKYPIHQLPDEGEEDMTLPDRLFKQSTAPRCQLDESDMTLPDKLFKQHREGQVKPKIISKSSSKLRNGLKDKFVLNIVENFNEQSNVLKELSNMKLSREKRRRKRGLVTLKKTWSSIINLAVGVPPLHSHNITSKKEHVESLYTDSMYSSLVGDMYKSRSTACIAAL